MGWSWDHAAVGTDFRENFHSNEVPLHRLGARSGSWCEIPLLATSFDDCRVRIASSAGAERTAAPCHETKAKPTVLVLVPHRGEVRSVEHEADGAARRGVNVQESSMIRRAGEAG
jgi:hypothetical protein